MTTPLPALLVILGLLPSLAQAGVEDKFLNSLKSNGYRCTDSPRRDGYFCTKGDTYLTVPKGMAAHTHNVFYAHGLVKVCKNRGASGEAYLENVSPTLKRIGAISIMPYRENASGTGFPLTSYLARVERELGSASVPLIMAGHSAAGSFLGAVLTTNPKVTRRVDQVLLIDAIYNKDGRPPGSASLWIDALGVNPMMKVQLVSSSTASVSAWWIKLVKPKFPSAILPLVVKGESHCTMPVHFDMLK